MSHLLEQDRTGLFTVVGAPYVAEDHHDTRSHYHQDSMAGRNGTFVAGLWLVLYAAIVVVGIASKTGAGRFVGTAMAFTQ